MNTCYRSFCTSGARFAVTLTGPNSRRLDRSLTEYSCGPHLPRLIRLNDPNGTGLSVAFIKEK